MLDSSFDFSPTSDKFITSTPNSNVNTKPKCSTISGLNVIVVNFQSFFNKRVEFSNLINDLKIDIVLASETWLYSNISNSELCLNDFDVFRNDRPSRGGGVFIAVRKELCGEVIPSCKDLESVFVKINVKGRKTVVLGSVYRPTESDNLDFCTKTMLQPW